MHDICIKEGMVELNDVCVCVKLIVERTVITIVKPFLNIYRITSSDSFIHYVIYPQYFPRARTWIALRGLGGEGITSLQRISSSTGLTD